MFGDDSTNKEFLLNGLNIAIIDKKIVEHELCNSLIKKLKDDSSSVNISTLSTVDELYKEISQNICDTSSCLLNMQWIDLVYNIRPSVMILFYYIVDVNLKDEEENNLSKIIDNIRSSDQNLPIYLFIIIPVQEYDKYQHLKEQKVSQQPFQTDQQAEFHPERYSSFYLPEYVPLMQNAVYDNQLYLHFRASQN